MKRIWKPRIKKGYLAAHAEFYGMDEVRRPAAQGKADSNQRDIVRAYTELHCSVLDLHAVGGGCGDLLVGIAGLVNDLVEIKLEDGQLRPSQVTFNRDWRGPKVIVIRSRADAIAHVKRVRDQLFKPKQEEMI